ncbi:hypothetical protein chiPu_0033039 [Chiloscyllium punctatum]|uniref:Uncharacterized protein n=1 Tax=Chiloscyllium punctatum TaxID=137246 RepID=A0A401U1Y0_CHIPU|nr:hypothetical protein [Chiloscyllium punctatum]
MKECWVDANIVTASRCEALQLSEDTQRVSGGLDNVSLRQDILGESLGKQEACRKGQEFPAVRAATHPGINQQR